MLLTLILACSTKPPTTAAPPVVTAVAAPDERSQALAALIADMDPAADPCTDFYRYACGGWLDRTTRPADQAVWSRSFSVIREDNRLFLHELLERAAADPWGGGAAGTPEAEDWRRLGHLYGSCMDEAGVEAAGLTPIEPLLTAVEGLASTADLPVLLAGLHANGIPAAFSLLTWADLKDPTVNQSYAWQAGLGLPDRDYYLRTDEASRSLQAEYRAHLAAMLVLAGSAQEEATASAEAVYALEEKIAGFSLPRSAMRDMMGIYNPRSLAELDKKAPVLGLSAYAAALGLDPANPLIVHDEAWFAALSAQVAATPLPTLRAWLRLSVLAALSPHLPDAFGQQQHAFFGQKIAGQAARKDRWKRCVDLAEAELGDALGRHYVASRFAGDSKEMVLQMVGGIEGAFRENLADVGWMDEQTRAAASGKVDTLTKKMGYPNAWLDTSTMELTVQPLAANALEARRFHVRRELDKVGKPVDREEWHMSAPTVNAYYNPSINEMVFPAGILQPPFFHRSLPAAVNHGAIGMVIAHELTHGFDDSGRLFDPTGAMREWWTEPSAKGFEERAACVEQQYAAYEVVDGMKLDGKLTLGENIADLGGLKFAWEAYKSTPAGAPTLEQLSEDQLFFVAFAQGWCTLASPEVERLRATTDTHSPPRYRVNGPLSNLPAFHSTFGCSAGQPMVRPSACSVW